MQAAFSEKEKYGKFALCSGHMLFALRLISLSVNSVHYVQLRKYIFPFVDFLQKIAIEISKNVLIDNALRLS